MNSLPSNIFIIINPTAKGERSKKWGKLIKESFPQEEIVETQHAGHARSLAEVAVQRGYKRIVAVGGDGTINEVVNGIAGADCELGIVPLGTMNVFALELGIPNEIQQAIEVARRGRVREIDLACANGQYFVQLAGVGFDAEAIKGINRRLKKVIGPLSYVLAGVKVAMQEAPILTVRTQEGREEQGCFVLVGNGRYYGGPFEIFPGAKLDDGCLEVCVFKRSSHMDLVHYFQGILCGTHTRFEDVEYFKASQLTVTADREVPMEVDGELAGMTPVMFDVKGKKLKVLVP